MFGVSLLIFVAMTRAVHTAVVPAKRSVLEESVVSLLKAEEESNADFQASVLKTLAGFHNQLGDILNKTGDEKSNNTFQKTVLSTLTVFHRQLEEIRNKSDFQHVLTKTLAQLHVEMEDLFENATKSYDEKFNDLNEKFSSNLQKILTTLYCPKHFHYFEHSCFKISKESTDWKTANARCLQHSSQLVSNYSSDVRNRALTFLLGQESSAKDNFVWAGGNFSGKGMDSDLLSSDQLALLKQWLPGKEFRLLYLATRDGMSPSAFHGKCDDKGATLSIGKDFESNTTFGGYASVSWGRDSGYRPDSNAFVFRLCGPECKSLKSNQYRNEHKALYDSSEYGPIFGGGNDLHFFGGNVTYDSSNKYFPSDGYCRRISYTYNSTLGCGYNVKWADVEVWRVIDSPCFALSPLNLKLENKPCTDVARYICELYQRKDV